MFQSLSQHCNKRLMASIIKRGNTWRAQIRRRGYQTVSASFDTKRQAEMWAAETEALMYRGQWQDRDASSQTKLVDALERYMTEVTPTKKGSKQETNRIKALQKLPLAQWYLSEITGKQVADLRKKRIEENKAPSSIRNELSIISQVFITAKKEWGMHSLKNPTEDIKRPKNPAGRERRLKKTEEERLLKVLVEPYRSAVIVALETAMRRGELCRLRWDDVNLTKRTAHCRDTKNGEDRVVPLSPRALAAIQAQPMGEGGQTLIFRTHSPDSFTHAFIAACKNANIHNLRLHDLRHEATSRLVESGLFELPEVMKITGHKTLSAFNGYMHIIAARLAERMASGANLVQ